MPTPTQARLHGVGLRTPHVAQVLEGGLPVGLVEVITENHLNRGGRAAAVLERLRRDVPVVFHGVSMSVGGTSPFPEDYLQHLDALVRRFEPAWVGDHFCFGGHQGLFGHDLWPLPFTLGCVEHLTRRIGQVQERLGRRLVLENVSSYLEHQANEMSEAEFLREVLERADCELLLDVNNLYVNARNHRFDPHAFLRAMPTERIRQIHLAGHRDMGTHLFDTHDGPVSDPVWALYQDCVRLHGPKPTIIEWDEALPPLDRLLAESARAAQVEAEALAQPVPQERRA